MKWVLIWWIVTFNGNGVATASAVFDNKVACYNAAHDIVGTDAKTLNPTYHDLVRAVCHPTG